MKAESTDNGGSAEKSAADSQEGVVMSGRRRRSLLPSGPSPHIQRMPAQPKEVYVFVCGGVALLDSLCKDSSSSGRVGGKADLTRVK